MTALKKIKWESIFMGKLDYGTDLYEEILKICQDKNIRLGKVEAIGAVKKARIGYYDQNKGEYRFKTINHPLEITFLSGNISLKDKNPFVHAHVTLADADGQAFGGHLASGTVVFACELIVHKFDGPEFNRKYRRETGLSLWD